ncbi:PaaI family thioesterase [Reyranella sp.]|uniref:PaaI family thioesterase n=1 Tax=Reyranella sp. TaxID=1929291 RepID=UPI003BAC2123
MGFFTLETAQAQLAPGGNFGPWIWALNLRAELVSPEAVRLRLPYGEHVARPGGVVIGQAMMAMADTIMVLAICEKLGRFATLATTSLTTNFLRAAVRQDVIAVGRVVKLGRTTAFGQVDLFVDGSDEPIAQALATFAVLPDGAGAFNRADQR